MIKLRGLGKTYKKKKRSGETIEFHALRDIDYHLEKGKSYAIVGESGSGKSTLAKIISGMETHDEGFMTIEKTEVRSLRFFSSKSVRRSIQLVHQDSYSALNPRMTVRECVLEPVRNLCPMKAEEEYRFVKELLHSVELDESVMNKKPSQLSGGQQKRVNIARAISINPELIILDEATSGLDIAVKKKILELLIKLQKERKCTLLFITHDIEVAMFASNHISVMEKGVIVEQVDFTDSLNCFKHSYSRTLIENTFL